VIKTPWRRDEETSMGERATAPADATTEAVATTGLFSIFIAVISLAVCLASVGQSDVGMATFAGIVAGLSFVASIVCFRTQARDRDPVEAPAPAPRPVPAQVQVAPQLAPAA